MDLQRSLLIGAIAVLSFMLLTNWVAFKDEKTAATAETTSRIISNSTSRNVEIPDVEESLASADSGLDDIPVAGAPIDDVQGPSNTGSTHSGRILQIHTNVMQVAIDMKGGDVIETALPAFLEKLDNPDVPFVLLEQNEKRVYIAQSGLIGPNGIDKGERPIFTSSASQFTMAEGEDSLQVDLNWNDDNGISIIKRFTLRRDSYLIDVEYLVDNRSGARWQANMFGQIKRDSSEDPAKSSGQGLTPFLGAATTQPDDRFTKFSFDDMAEEPFKAQLPGGWIAMIQHYFLSAWIPNPDQTHTYTTRVTKNGFNIAGFTSPALSLDPGNSGSISAGFYAGPKDQYTLEEISPYLELSVDYGWLWWIAQPLFWLLTNIHALVGNWGFAIIFLTVLIKAAFFKLSAVSFELYISAV
jgi:YidC/Oxa1 family membrane protein insertase